MRWSGSGAGRARVAAMAIALAMAGLLHVGAPGDAHARSGDAANLCRDAPPGDWAAAGSLGAAPTRGRAQSFAHIAWTTQVEPLADVGLYSRYDGSELALVAGTDPANTTLLHPYAAYAFGHLRAAAERAGHRIHIWSGWRPWDIQERAHHTFLRSGRNLSGRRVPNVAHPCVSRHPAGLAVDLDVRERSALERWLDANAAAYGFVKTRDDEPWHWEFVGIVKSPPPQAVAAEPL